MITIKEKDSDQQVAAMKERLDRGLVLTNSAGTKLERAGLEYETTTKGGKREIFCNLYRVALKRNGTIQAWFA